VPGLVVHEHHRAVGACAAHLAHALGGGFALLLAHLPSSTVSRDEADGDGD
jgi:hypothetical protein